MNDLFRAQLHGSREQQRDNYPATIRDAALGFAETLLVAYDDGEVNVQYGYGRQTYRSESVTLAGGGPGAEIIFAFREDGDLDHAYIDYCDVAGNQVVRIPDWYAEKLAEAMGVS